MFVYEVKMQPLEIKPEWRCENDMNEATNRASREDGCAKKEERP